MRNIIGSPAEGDDFFNRPKILDRLRRELNNQANILLVAPRRVGKTSLVIRLCDDWRKVKPQQAVFLNVEGRGDELAFAEKLIEELARAGLHPELLTRATSLFTKLRQGLGGKGIQLPGLEISLGEGADPEHSTLAKVLESIFRKIEDSPVPVLIAIDELPEFLLTLQKAAEGPRRVAAFLHWLRELRQTYRQKIRWVFLGSIGLDNFVEDQKLHNSINDLKVFALEAFTAPEAEAFLKELEKTNAPELADADRHEIIRLMGWPIAHHLKLIFEELSEIVPLSIDKAFESLLQPQKFTHFATWHQRIETQFSAPDAAACKSILRHLCLHAQGRERGQILDLLMVKPTADVEKVEEQLSRLLIVLQRDGYLLESGGRYAFRSFLLREYWHRRHVK